MKSSSFKFGDWQVDVRMCRVRHVAETAETQIEPRAMDVLSALCHRAGTILSADDLLHLCWDGVVVGENQVHKAIAQLRRALRDSSTDPVYIENIRKRGYRTLAPVTFPPGYGAGAVEETWTRASPYIGLDPFDAAHADVFFGRETAVTRLCAAMAGRLAAGRPFVLVLGPSGSGKTSLIQAGLLPALTAGSGGFRVEGIASLDLGDVANLPLPTALGGALLDLERDGEPLFAGHSAESIGTALTGEGESLPPGARHPDEPGRNPARFVLFIDRMEALFNTPMAGILQRSQFLTALDRLARLGPFAVIGACRNDFYPDLAREPLLMAGKETGAHFDLEPPTRTEIAQMIRRPAEMAGLSFGIDLNSNEHLDDLLCEGVANNTDALPLLQYTLQQLYLQRSPTRELTIEAYRKLGGIDGAIGRRAEAILEGLPPQAQAALPRIFSLIVAAGGADGNARSLRAPWSVLATAEERQLVTNFVDQRLFVSLSHGREPVFGVAHEALLRQWPRAVAWIAEHRQALRIRARLEAEAQQWIAEGRRTDRLLRQGRPLEEARELLKTRAVPLSPDISALITASARQARRADRLRLGAVVGFALIAMVAVVQGYQARQAEALAAQRRQEAEGLVDFMLGDLTQKLQPLARLDLLGGVAEKALAYLTEEDAGRVPGPLRLRQAKALLTLADVNRSRGNVDAALTALGRAETLLRVNLAEGPVDGALLKTAGAVAFWFGQIALDRRNLDEAEQHFIRYRDLAKSMVALNAEDEDASLELSYALASLGSLRLRRDQVSEAAQDFEESNRLKRAVMAKRPDDRALAVSMANGLSWLANARAQDGRLDDAVTLYGQQKDMLEGLRKAEPDALEWSNRLALAYKLEAILLAARGKTEAALASLQKSSDLIGYLLNKEPENSLWQRQKTENDVLGARFHLFANDLTGAASRLSGSLVWLEQALAAKPGDGYVRRLLGQALANRAELLLLTGDVKGAGASAAKAEAIVREGPQDASRAVLTANILLVQATVERARRNADAAAAFCGEAVRLLGPIAATTHDYKILDPWVRANICAGTLSAAVGGMSRLEKIGYADVQYQRLTSSTLKQGDVK